MKKLLIVEDNETIIKGLKYSLEQENFSVSVCMRIEQAKEKVLEDNYDLIILDITLPDGSGFELCKYIKTMVNTPIIFLTAKDEEQDVVMGLDMGAEDYVIKPFRTRELISRINTIFRRSGEENNKIICRNILIDLDATKVYVCGEEQTFTSLEYKILLLLFNNLNKTISREQILDKIWDVAGNFVNDNTLTVYIKRIRNKLGNEDVIKTIKGIGYRVDK